jgi:membrane protein implicated in regulation of membrane protease activity
MNRAFYILIIPGVIIALGYIAVGWGVRGLIVVGCVLALAALLYPILRRRSARSSRPQPKL